MATASLAVVSVVFIEWWGISTLGFFAYGSKFFNVGPLLRGKPTGIIDLLVGLIEFVAEVARLISFSFRLFGNIIAGEILLLIMTFLLPFFFVAISAFYGLEILVGAIQALVFGMLTLVFAVMAVSGHGGEGEHAEESH
jgi:F-type H+-transporting ATPase subunit a